MSTGVVISKLCPSIVNPQNVIIFDIQMCRYHVYVRVHSF